MLLFLVAVANALFLRIELVCAPQPAENSALLLLDRVRRAFLRDRRHQTLRRSRPLRRSRLLRVCRPFLAWEAVWLTRTAASWLCDEGASPSNGICGTALVVQHHARQLAAAAGS